MSFLRKQESGYIEGLDSASKPALSKAEWVRNENSPNHMSQTTNSTKIKDIIWTLFTQTDRVGLNINYNFHIDNNISQFVILRRSRRISPLEQ